MRVPTPIWHRSLQSRPPASHGPQRYPNIWPDLHQPTRSTAACHHGSSPREHSSPTWRAPIRLERRRVASMTRPRRAAGHQFRRDHQRCRRLDNRVHQPCRPQTLGAPAARGVSPDGQASVSPPPECPPPKKKPRHPMSSDGSHRHLARGPPRLKSPPRRCSHRDPVRASLLSPCCRVCVQEENGK